VKFETPSPLRAFIDRNTLTLTQHVRRTACVSRPISFTLAIGSSPLQPMYEKLQRVLEHRYRPDVPIASAARGEGFSPPNRNATPAASGNTETVAVLLIM
jgi:hypothetical protein